MVPSKFLMWDNSLSNVLAVFGPVLKCSPPGSVYNSGDLRFLPVYCGGTICEHSSGVTTVTERMLAQVIDWKGRGCLARIWDRPSILSIKSNSLWTGSALRCEFLVLIMRICLPYKGAPICGKSPPPPHIRVSFPREGKLPRWAARLMSVSAPFDLTCSLKKVARNQRYNSCFTVPEKGLAESGCFRSVFFFRK